MRSSDFDVDQGTSFEAEVLELDSVGNPMDMTGAVLVGQIRKTASSPTVVGNFSFVLTDLSQGSFSITLTPKVTSALPCDPSPTAARITTDFAYDIEAHYPDGTVDRLLGGVLHVSPEVTRN